MSKLITQEIAIVIAVPVENPTILNEVFLKQTGIIPIDWQLEREPVYSDRVAQIMFTNGLSIVAQPDRLMFLEMVGDKSIETLRAGEVAQKYVSILKMADYRSVGINFRSYAPQNSPDSATEYINNKLLTTGNWQQYGTEKMRASINLNYDLGDRQLNLSIDAATIQFPTPLTHPAVIFSGTFSYDTTAHSGDRVDKIFTILGKWQQELNEFSSFISERLLFENSDIQESIKSVINDIKIVDAPALPPLLLTYN
ncbi:hypothetical protein [Chamaesiphon minutus]|uniref:TIGR04255 family protein n=1 Tax=Chamaesiphon minutus (strain ATCC 27169 / PCC 6605) TaxID=1173020 RepID=K9UJR3_CHAP6|nr:hypothetical protein [Chamaesiphon minutus]AFY94439.1 hypothetical protein Cha6605_3447 [Chamaesiphon minutus PCC 6605]